MSYTSHSLNSSFNSQLLTLQRSSRSWTRSNINYADIYEFYYYLTHFQRCLRELLSILGSQIILQSTFNVRVLELRMELSGVLNSWLAFDISAHWYISFAFQSYSSLTSVTSTSRCKQAHSASIQETYQVYMLKYFTRLSTSTLKSFLILYLPFQLSIR